MCRRLKTARRLAGLSLGQAARLFRGSVTWLANVEAGAQPLTAHEMECFASVYACTVDWFLGRVPERVERSELVTAMRKMRRPLDPETEDDILIILALGQSASQEKQSAPTAIGD